MWLVVLVSSTAKLKLPAKVVNCGSKISRPIRQILVGLDAYQSPDGPLAHSCPAAAPVLFIPFMINTISGLEEDLTRPHSLCD
jgi:hypothetical protein